jgi:Protein of unknown function (DUF3747)
VIHSLRALVALATAVPLAGLLPALVPQTAQAQSLFGAAELDQSRFIIVAAPIGSGERAQLNIYEQRSDARPCYAVQGAKPGVVNPLLATFDFTGICNRYIDANGYSLRVGGTDLATQYRLSVVRQNGDNQLLAIPTKAGAGAEMVVARSGGHAPGFLLLVPEPGWKLMRRTFGGRALGHLYVYRDTLPGAVGAPTAGQPSPAPAPAAATAPAAKPALLPPAPPSGRRP